MGMYPVAVVLQYTKNTLHTLKTIHNRQNYKHNAHKIANTINLGIKWGGWLTPRSGCFTPPPPKEKTRYLLYRRLGGLQDRSGRGRKTLPPPGFFLYSLVLCLYFILCLHCPPFCLLVFTYNTQHKHPCPRRDSNPQSQQASGYRPTP
jgi:hypothetical protein